MKTLKELFSWETEGAYVLQTWPDAWISDYKNLRDFSIEFWMSIYTIVNYKMQNYVS